MTGSLNENPGCLGWLFGIRRAAEVEQRLPYRLRDDFLSTAEKSFYRVLCLVVGDDAVVFSKVNLADIFFVVRLHENLVYRNKINRKHVDFLLCDPKTLNPIAGIELDDVSHNRADRKERDNFVNSVFETVALPLVHVAARSSYGAAELTELLAPHFNDLLEAVEELPSAEDTDEQSVPTCGKCGVPMVLRTATRGDRAGHQFWGCVNYPKCRQTKALANER